MRIIMEQMATNISCRTFHSVGQQLARWLLSYGQGDPIETIQITHGELANALGLRRERVTLALNEAARQGCISLNRGRITVQDDQKLKALSCQCSSEPTLNKVWSEKELEGIGSLPAKLKKQVMEAVFPSVNLDAQR